MGLATHDESRWALELMEERLKHTEQTPEELSKRAGELRRQASETDLAAHRDAALALAERYEAVAAARLASA